MIRNASSVYRLQTYNETFPIEILNWCFNHTEDVVLIIWNTDHEIIYVSNQMENYYDGTVENLIGESWTTIFPEKKIMEITNHFHSSKEALHYTNVPFYKQGETFSFRATIDVIEIDGETHFICKLKNDTYVTELKKVLLDSEKLILAGQLSAGLVHEIRNPLTSLKGFLQLVQAGVEQKEEYYKVMIGEIDKLEKITSELLHMAKPLEHHKQNEYLYELAEDVIFIMSTQMDMRGVKFETHFDESVICYCNAQQIKQVLINIIKNGAEAMKKEGTLTIAVRQVGQEAKVEITDEGEGMSKEVVQGLNHPFFTTKSDGTGLGLVVSHHILDMHEGKMNVRSSVGEGTTFEIILPAIIV